MNGEMVRQLNRLFVHRSDTYATQQEDGSYWRVNAPLDDDVLTAHVNGDVTVGGYQIDPKTNSVRWICFDYDGDSDEELRTAVKATRETLLRLGVPPSAMLVEDSARRGYHLWVFLSGPYPLAPVHGLAFKIANETTVPATVKNMHLEVFPKQGSLPSDGFGNLVKLPLGVHRVSGRRSIFVSPETFEPLEWQVMKRVEPWSPPPGMLKTAESERKKYEEFEPTMEGDFPCWVKISKGEIPEGMRHNIALAFASHLRDKGLAAGVAKIVVREWWSRLPQPPEAKTRLEWNDVDRALRDAYARGYYIGCKLIRKRWPEMCSPDCPLLRKKPVHFPALTLRQENATDRIELCGGEYLLEAHGSHTVLYAPITRRKVSKRGRYLGWSPGKWDAFVNKAASAFKDGKLADELKNMREAYRAKWAEHEIAAVDDDSLSPPDFHALHKIEVHYSRKRNYVRVQGASFHHRTHLKRFMDWDPLTKSWRSPFSEFVLNRAIRFARENDRRMDPTEQGLVKCWVCRRWVPEADATRTRNGWSCGCLSRFKQP